MAKKAVKIKVIELEDDTSFEKEDSAPVSKRKSDEDLLPEGIENDPIPKSSCALWFIFLILAIILLTIIGALFYLKTKNLSFNKEKVNLNINSTQASALSGEEVTIKLTENQLDSALKTGDTNFPLKKAKTKVLADKIVLSGKTSNNFWGLLVEVGLLPKAESGKLKLDIIEIKSAGLKAPNSISDLVNNNLGQYLDGLSSSIGNVEVLDVKLEQGYMTVEGRQK